MKKKISCILTGILFYGFVYCQAGLDPTQYRGVLIDGTPVNVDFEPGDFAPDIYPEPIPEESDRLIIWVHGLGGQGDDAGTTEISWSQASYATDYTYKTISRRPDYADVSLDGAADELKTDFDIDYADASDDRTFVIAHSQGGIVSRRVDKLYHDFGEADDETFHGLVMFGSPNQGAEILNNVNDLVPWIDETCNDLTAGPVAELIENNFWLDLLLTDYVAEDEFENIFCSIFVDNIAPVIFKDYLSGITESYEVGSSQLADLNAYTPDMPYVCFYGIEDAEPLIWNTLVYVTPGHLPNDHPPFEAGNDPTLVNFANDNLVRYQSKYEEYATASDELNDYLNGWGKITEFLPVFDIYNAVLEFQVQDDEYIRDQYAKGLNWWLEANDTWKTLIGAEEYLPGATECLCLDEADFDLDVTEYPIEPGESCDEDWGDCSVFTDYGTVTYPSDGVVLASSAGNCPGMTYSIPMTGSNHFSMRNDSNTQIKLDGLMNGDYGYYFHTDFRIP